MNPIVKAIEFSLYPGEPFNANQTLRDFLAAIEENTALLPTTWGGAERDRLEYKKEDILARTATTGNLPGIVYIHRNKIIKYDGSLDLGNFRFLHFAFDKFLPEDQWPSLLQLFDRLAAAIKTRFAVCHIFREVPLPWSSDADRFRAWMNFAAAPVPSLFRKNGPLGLGLRTIVGGDMIDLFGRQRLLSVPAQTAELPWGGIRIDLAKDPWNVDPTVLAKTWKAVMDHLEPAQAFAVPKFDEARGGVLFSPSPAKIQARRSGTGRKET